MSQWVFRFISSKKLQQPQVAHGPPKTLSKCRWERESITHGTQKMRKVGRFEVQYSMYHVRACLSLSKFHVFSCCRRMMICSCFFHDTHAASRLLDVILMYI